jgi:endonuclease YncB( thermonuclease family)
MAETLVGRIIGVSDGDTLTLLDAGKQTHKIRLSGVDAPEKKQAYGQQSKLNLSNLAYGHEATADCPKRDRYRRPVCLVTVAGKDVGLQQIHQGLAWWYRTYAHEQRAQDRRGYERAEQMAREKRVGLWREKDPKAPWEWRRERREQSTAKRQGKSALWTGKVAHRG